MNCRNFQIRHWVEKVFLMAVGGSVFVYDVHPFAMVKKVKDPWEAYLHFQHTPKEIYRANAGD